MRLRSRTRISTRTRVIASYRTAAVLAVAAAVAIRISPGDGVAVDAWRAFVTAAGTWGAVRFARHAAPTIVERSWSPWVAGVLYGCGPVLMSSALRAPLDALVYASLPWLALPLLRVSVGWRYAAPATGLTLAGLGSAPWTVAAVGVGLLAALPRRSTELGDSARWLAVALLASGWWVVAWALDPSDLSVGRPGNLGDGLARAAGSAELGIGWAALVVGGPIVCAFAYLLWWEAPGRYRLAVAALLAGAAAVTLWYLSAAAPSSLPVAKVISAPDTLLAHGQATSSDVLGSGLALAALGGLLSWAPLTAHLLARARTRHALATIVLVVVAAVSAAGVLYAAHERVPGSRFDHEMAGFSTQTKVAAPSG